MRELGRWWNWRRGKDVTISGCDVSNWNAPIDWPTAAKGGIAFALTKCTEGTSYADPTFAANWAGMAANGIARGAYHFARPSLNQPTAEAAFFLAHVGPLSVGDVVALDLEDGTGDLSAWTLTWLQTVEAALGFKPLLYSAPWFMAAHGISTPDLAQYGLWLASWGVVSPIVPAPWTFWAVWQSSAQGTAAGVPGSVDIDTFAGDVEHFKMYGLPAPQPKPAPTNDDYEQLHRLVDAQPFDAGALVSYAQRFV